MTAGERQPSSDVRAIYRETFDGTRTVCRIEDPRSDGAWIQSTVSVSLDVIDDA